jgi:hypothetical protein
MGEVVRLPRKKRQTIRGAARACMSEALDSAAKPVSVVVVVLGENGTFAMRSANIEGRIADFDMYSRAAALMDQARMRLVG